MEIASRNYRPQRQPPIARPAFGAFTIPELLITIAIIFLLAALLLPALVGAKERGKAVICLSNFRQLGAALHMYAGDHDDAFPDNMGPEGIHASVASGEYLNWANNVMSWELDAENTNGLLLATTGLGPYCGGVAKMFKCPSDAVLSAVQRDAGWKERVRSVSMNAMIGNAGEFMKTSVNTNNPTYRQFLRLTDVPDPSRIFVFIEEHPDSIDDGYFLNRFYSGKWNDLPAAYHYGGTPLAYVDGHAEMHQWKFASTKPPPLPDAAGLPMTVPSGERGDLYWLLSQTSVHAEETVTTAASR
jgi:prepilin-type processing-associated H-X9-DG protein